MTLGSI
jgi:hypothetical protein